MAYDPKLKEEEIKNKVAADLFPSYDCTRILGKIDFCVQPKDQGPMLWETESLLWAEAKNGIHRDVAPLFAQLVLTIGGEKTYEKHSPPPFLGAFDSEKIAFLPWHTVLDLLFRSDIDFTTTPSDWTSSAFTHVLGLVQPIVGANLVQFQFSDPDLAKFTKMNLVVGATGTSQLQVTRNNFPFVYQKWLKVVKPSIAINWALARKQGIHDADFYDIRAHFQGFKPNGHMNPDSYDAGYSERIAALRLAVKALAAKIKPKVYEHGFLQG